MQPFRQPLDIANRALMRVGAPLLTSFYDDSKSAQLAGFCYAPLREAELRRHPWRFATRRATIRPVTTSSLRISPPLWDSGAVVYSIGSIVRDVNGNYWFAIVPHTSSTDPSVTPGYAYSGLQDVFWKEWFGNIVGDAWSSTANYFKGELVTSGGTDWYVSIANNNLNHVVTNTTYWTHLTGASGVPAFYMNDIGPGVTVQGLAQNIFPLPCGYLRMTYAGVKAPSAAHNVISAGLQFNDWQIEDDYIVSSSSGPLHIRFIADLTDVLSFDPLFSEAFAARIAYELCEGLTQSQAKSQQIAQAYQKFMDEARTVNWIETASDEPQENGYEASQGAADVNQGSPARAAPPQGR